MTGMCSGSYGWVCPVQPVSRRPEEMAETDGQQEGIGDRFSLGRAFREGAQALQEVGSPVCGRAGLRRVTQANEALQYGGAVEQVLPPGDAEQGANAQRVLLGDASPDALSPPVVADQ